jgi:hypothetical protein
LYAVTSGPLYVAVGEAGSLLSSVDGWSWTVRSSGVLFDLYCVASDPPQNAFIAAGQQGTVTLGDGVNWTAITSPTEQDLLAVAGASDLNNHGTFALGGTSGLFICLDDVYVSSWHEQSSWSSANIRGLCHLDGEFLGVGDHGMIGCGLIWFHRLSNTTSNLNAAAYGGGRYVVVGDGGSITTSVDAQTWTPATAGSQTLNWITYGVGRFVAVGNGFVVAVSTNGLNWTNFTLTPPPYSFQAWFTHVAYGNGAFIASGYYLIPSPYVVPTAIDVIALSPDGINWQMYTNLPPPYYSSGVPLAPACAGPNTFFLCGSNISTSSDGITWTPRANIAVPWLAASSNLFVGLDGAGSSVYSPDGTNWTVVPTAQTTDGNNLTYGDGSFITVGLPNIFYGSTDGITWVRGVFGEIYTQHIAHGFNSFIVVGAVGLLLQSSPSVLPPRLEANRSTNGQNLVLISEPGRPVDLQASSDLNSWTFWTNLTPIEGSTTISVPAVGQKKFFRAAAH